MGMTHNYVSTVRIEAPREQVWNVLADLGGISEWTALITESKADGEAGKGAVRHCTFPDGSHVQERFVAWEEGALMGYEITGDVPSGGVATEWSLAEDAGATTVTYTATLSDGSEAPAPFKQLVDLLLASLKTYVETGKVLALPEA